MVRSVRTGPQRKSPAELARRWWTTANGGVREDSPPTTLAGLCFFPQIWFDPSERGLDEKVRRSSPDGRRSAGGRPPPPAAGGVPRPPPPPGHFFSPKFCSIQPQKGPPPK